MNYFFIKYFVRTKIKLFQSRCQCQFWCWWRWRCHNFRMAPRMYHNCDGNFSLSVRIIRLLSILLILFSWFELINKWFAVNYFRNFTYAKLREKKSWLAQCINISWVKVEYHEAEGVFRTLWNIWDGAFQKKTSSCMFDRVLNTTMMKPFRYT